MLIFAHRGFADEEVCENTLPAFERAVQRRADGIECDLRVSRDGVLIVCHDKRLDRISHDSRRASQLTIRELRQLQLSGPGSIPMLNEVTAAIPAPMQLDLEIKDRDVVPLLITKLKTSAALRERTIVSSFSLENVRKVKAACPDVRTLVLKRTWPLPVSGRRFWRRLEAAGIWGVGFPGRTLTRRGIASARRRGFKVASWDLRKNHKETRRVLGLEPDIAIVFDLAHA